MVSEVDDRSIFDLAADWWKRRKWLFIASFLIVFTVAASLVRALPPLYRASTTFVFSENEIAESLVTPDSSNDLELRLAAIREAVLSRSELQQVIDSFGLYADLMRNAPPESVIRRFRRDIDIEQSTATEPQWGKKSTYIVTIGFRYWDPQHVAAVANELAARFQAENTRIRRAQAARTAEFVRSQVDAARTELRRQESRLGAFRNAHLGELPEQQSYNIAVLERLNEELRLNRERQAELLMAREGIPSSTLTVPSASASRLTGRSRLEQLQRDLAAMQGRYTDAHPQVIRLQREIDRLTQELIDEGGGRMGQADEPLVTPEDLRRNEARLRDEIAAVTQRIETTPQIDQNLQRIAYDYNAAKDAYLSLQKLYREAHLAQSLEQRQDQQFKVTEAAIPPDFPSAPNRMRLIFMGFVLAAAIAGLVVFVAERTDKRFYSLADIRRFTRVPVLASIGPMPTTADTFRRRAGAVTMWIFVIIGLLLVASIGNYIGSNAHGLVATLLA
jgi:polysaccharide chain length determinant protein (PEP-CTERM system associated)